MKHLFPGATGHFSLIQGCYWMTYCILISFSSLYLLDRGFTNTQIGLLLGIAGLTAAILQPFVGAKGDHLKVLSLRQFTSLPIAAMILCGVGLFLVPAKPVQAALYMVLLVLLQLLTPLIYSLGMDCLNNHIELNFGLARGIGGGTYALASAVCGSLAAALGARVIPLVLVVAVALMLAFTFTFRQGGPVKSTLPKPDALPQSDGTPFLKKYPQVLPLLIGVILLCFGALICLLMALLVDAVVGLLFASPFFLCGVLCLLIRKNTGLWCAWAVFGCVSMYLYFATGITWRLLLLIPIYTASMNYARLVIACVHLLLLLLLVALTVIRFSKKPFPVTKRGLLLLIAGWAAFIGCFFIRIPLSGMSSMVGWLLCFLLIDAPRCALLTVLLTFTVRLLRTRRAARKS